MEMPHLLPALSYDDYGIRFDIAISASIKYHAGHGVKRIIPSDSSFYAVIYDKPEHRDAAYAKLYETRCANISNFI